MNTANRRYIRLVRPALFFMILALFLALSIKSSAAATGYDWLQFDLNAQHSGNNTQEVLVSAANVSQLAQLFQVTLPGVADGAPVYLTNVNTAGGVRDLVFVATKAADLIALDAQSGAVVWTAHNPSPAACKDSNGGACYITASPAIDPNRSYIYTYGLDGFVHKYNVGNGSEISGNGWPELVTTKVTTEKGSSDLTVTASHLYVTNGGYPGDGGDYQGHVTAINLASGAQNIFNTVCSDQTVHFLLIPQTPDCSARNSAVWARVGVIYDSDNNKLFISSGNGPFDPANFDWGDSVLALNPDGTGAAGGNPLDSYTPTNFVALDNADADLGSTAPAVLPVANGHHYAVQGGKDAQLRIIDLDNLSGKRGPGHTGGELAGSYIPVPQGGEVLTQPAVWIDPQSGKTWSFVGNDNGISGLPLTATENGWSTGGWRVFSGCTSPIVANNVLYCAGGGKIRARDPLTGAELWVANIGRIHWESPILANGILYMADESQHLTAFSLKGIIPATPTAAATAAPTTAPTAAATSTPTIAVTNLSSTSAPSILIADPLIAKFADVQLAQPNSPVSFTITVTNNGGANATSVVVVDPVPVLLVVQSATSTQGSFLVNRAQNSVTFTIGTVPPGQIVTLTIQTLVSPAAKAPVNTNNSATLTDSDGQTRTASVPVRVTAGKLPTTGEHPDNLTQSWLPLGALFLAILGSAVLVANLKWLWKRRHNSR